VQDPTTQPFLLGIVEGFYGRMWTDDIRLKYAQYLGSAGLNTYLYCPKGDPFLRKQWQRDWPSEQRHILKEFFDACRKEGIACGVGLSPFKLYADYGARAQAALRRKVEALAEFEAPILAILFDDMPGDLPDLAHSQSQIVSDVCKWLPGVRILVCPTYYSFDPQLESYFGEMPKNYWSSLGELLPEQVDIFWTGNQVCSEQIKLQDIERINDFLGRKVILWDNYPVNDGAARCEHLYTDAPQGRPRKLRGLLTGHLCNPMNQALLSLPAIAGLAALYGKSGLAEAELASILGEGTWRQLLADKNGFAQEGRLGMGEQECLKLAAVYDRLPGKASGEISQWLRGAYQFDPACLTD